MRAGSPGRPVSQRLLERATGSLESCLSHCCSSLILSLVFSVFEPEKPYLVLPLGGRILQPFFGYRLRVYVLGVEQLRVKAQPKER